ncbi:MAG: hypothetical protein KAV83_02580 [Desulfobacterales bacterium]|nr:hypothetical protein [Desulfobacterales bacterium]
MTFAMEKSSASSEIRALDPDLPFLASEAAVDLANLRYGESKRMVAIHHLADRLKESIKKDSSGVPSRSLVDPDALTVLGGAVVESTSAAQSSQKIDDLLARALVIAEFLSSENMQDDPGKMEEAMNFCAALSRAAIAYRRSIRDLSPSHPFRR